MKELSRLGPRDKCPACGWQLDTDAYRCPKCKIYVCFKCRRRVTTSESQYECHNQKCQYYGKLFCGVCIKLIPEIETRQQLQTTYGGWKIIGIIATLLGIVTMGLSLSIISGLIALVVAFVVGCIIAAANGWRIADETKCVATRYKVGEQMVCIACKEPLRILR